MDKYPPELEERMRCFYNSLNEKERRLYAGLEALRIGHDGRNYIASGNRSAPQIKKQHSSLKIVISY